MSFTLQPSQSEPTGPPEERQPAVPELSSLEAIDETAGPTEESNESVNTNESADTNESAVTKDASPNEETSGTKTPLSVRDSLVIADLPEEVLAFLVRGTPPQVLWKWLNEAERSSLLYSATRGFQRQASALRQPSVRRRLTQALTKDAAEFYSLLNVWAGINPEPTVITAVRELDDDSALASQLPFLWAQHGGEALLLALVVEERAAALDALSEVDPESLPAEETEPKPADELASPNAAPSVEPVDEVIAGLRRELEAARQETTAAAGRATRAAAELAELQARTSREIQNAQARVLKVERRAQLAEQELAEAKRALDRTSRRQRHAEREQEELQTENKRLKKQLRQAQQLHEETRKQLARVQARNEQLEPPKPEEELPVPLPAPKPIKGLAKPKPLTPFDMVFEWKSDGRKFRVTPREVARAIERNDEEFVFRLIQAFDDMRAQSEDYYKLFIQRTREMAVYYARVLTAETTRVLVDASNVVRYETDKRGKGRLENLLRMREDLRLRDCFPILIYADASLPYFIDNPQGLMELARQGEVMMVDKGVEADEILAREARRSGGYVVTNDKGFHLKVSPDFEPPRITFRIIEHHLILDEF